MPIYEYQCDACGATLEKLQKLADAPLRDCPKCGEAALKKLVSAAGFRLKGGGWYETDFKKGKQKNLHDSAHKDSAPAKDSGAAVEKPAGKAGKPEKAGSAGKTPTPTGKN